MPPPPRHPSKSGRRRRRQGGPRRNDSRGTPRADGRRGPTSRGKGAPALKRASKKRAQRKRGARKRYARDERIEEARRFEEIEQLEAKLQALKQEKLKIALRPIREERLPRRGITPKKGRRYDTWFKAAGSFAAGRGWDSYDRMQHLLDEVEIDTNAPAAFYSGHILGKVKWRDTIKPLQSCFDDLNAVGGWSGDFRDIYPNWSYEYRVVESIGGVPVRIWVKRQRGGR